MADLPEATRAALLVAALTDRADVTEVLAAASVLAETPLTLDALTPAVAAGLIEVDELRIAFGHPLMRSAIGQGGSESRRRAAHEALAATLAHDHALARPSRRGRGRRDRRHARGRARRARAPRAAARVDGAAPRRRSAERPR